MMKTRFGGGLGLGLRRRNVAGGGGPTPPAVALDPAVTTAIAANTKEAFAFDRIVQGFVGATARFQRTSDNAQSDFGFNAATGKFDKAGLKAWSGGAATLVHLYSQMGTGKLLAANTATSIPVVAGGITKSLSTDWNAADGQLATNENGGLAVPITGGAYLNLSNSGIAASGGCEFHILAAPLARKKATATVDAVELGATNTAESLFSYGVSSTNFFRFVFGGGSGAGLLRRQGTGGGGTDQIFTTTNVLYFKKLGQLVLSLRNDNTEISTYGLGRRIQTAAPSAGNITANGALDNGQLRVGASYGNDTFGNCLFSGIIVTSVLAAKDRTYIHNALNAVAQQHQIIDTNALYALFDEIIDFRDVDANGLVAGRKGKTGIQFNKTVGAPTFDFAYITPQQGLQGIRSPTANADNTYRATNNYFTDVFAGTMLTYCVNENTTINQTWSLRSDSDTSDFSLGMGRHHTQFNVQRCCAASRDTQGWTRHLYPVDGGDGGGGVLSQAVCKYQFNFPHGEYTPNKTTTADITSSLYGVTIPSGSVLSMALAKTVSWYAPLPEEESYADQVDLKDSSIVGELALHIATFKNGPNYNPADAEATRRQFMRTSTCWSFTSHPGVPIGHMDGSVAREIGTGSVIDSDPTHRIQSNSYQGSVNIGTHIMWAFAKTDLTRDQIEKINVNLYKFIYSGYPA